VIPTLLWRCPLCHVEDALQHTVHWFRNDEVECRACSTAWEVWRVLGRDFRLRVVGGEPAMIGREEALADWYDLMKASVRLVPRPEVGPSLEEGEDCYLRSHMADLFMEEDNPLLELWTEEAPWASERDPGLSFTEKAASGHLWLTSERFIWMSGEQRLTFRLTRILAAYAQGNRFFAIIYGQRLYKLRFRQESILKWLTYTALVAQRLEQVADHRIALSNY
jgi:hypothetical protein